MHPDPPGDRGAEVTRCIEAAAGGDAAAGERLLPLLYDELRELARSRLARERPGQTLQATALVHEAWLRLVGTADPGTARWDGRGHFFAAAAEAMRRILVERARRRGAAKRGGDRRRVDLDSGLFVAEEPEDDLLALDEALNKLEEYDPRKGRVVLLRFFAGLSIEETAAALEVSPATVKTDWSYSRAFLHRELAGVEPAP